VRAKYFECTAGILSHAQAAEAVDMISNLERVDRIADLVDALSTRRTM
jgi:hypothetical protein